MEEIVILWSFQTCEFCPYRSKSSFIMSNHLKLHETKCRTESFTCELSKPEMHKCEFCEVDTDLKVNLREHISECHEEKTNKATENKLQFYRCENCDFTTHSVLVLMGHTANNCKHHNKKPEKVRMHKCEYCSYECVLKGNLKRHFFLRHAQGADIKWHKCTKCSFKTKRRWQLKPHMEAKHMNPDNVDWLECEQCSFKALYGGNLKRHIRYRHTDAKYIKWFECGHCKFKAKEKSKLKRHILLKHSNPEDITWFKCEHCSFKAKLNSNLKQHILKLHTPKVNKKASRIHSLSVSSN